MSLVNKKLGIHSAYTNLQALILERYKIGVLKLVLFWCFCICSNFVKYYDQGETWKSILFKNNCPHDMACKCSKEV